MVHRICDEPGGAADRVIDVQPEVVVVGAGPSGLAVARELEHRHGISTLVVEPLLRAGRIQRTAFDLEPRPFYGLRHKERYRGKAGDALLTMIERG